MVRLLRDYPTEAKLLGTLLILFVGLAIASPSFFTTAGVGDASSRA